MLKKSLVLLIGCLIFACLQIYLNYHTMITPDEFWFVHSVYHKYRLLVPYRDFAPYKSVFGYYLLLLPTFIINDPYYTLVWIKHFITVYNALFLFICSLW